jgi:hypothetical protein
MSEATAEADRQFTIFDSSALLKKQSLVFVKGSISLGFLFFIRLFLGVDNSY